MLSALVDVHTLPSLVDEPMLYPDGRPAAEQTDFAYRGGQFQTLSAPFDATRVDAWLRAGGAAGLSGRVASLAVGSNAYPRQLHDKLAASPADREGLLTVRARVRGVDTAYCPIRARKGYVPVTLATRPGVTAPTWLQWLTPAQLALIGATEGPRYALVGGAALADCVSLPDGLPRPQRIYAWWFDAVLERAERTLWLADHAQADVWARFEECGSIPQTPPAGWEIAAREGPDWAARIAQM